MINKLELEARACMCPEYDRETRGKDQITALADGYCAASDRFKAATTDDERDEAMCDRDNYISALMLKFWDQINTLYTKTKTVGTLSYEDCCDKLYERIEYACKYRRWQTDAKTNAQACINQAISTEVKNIFYFANMDKNKANSAALRTSLDTKIDSDSETTFADTLVDTEKLPDERVDDSEFFIQGFIDHDKLVEAIILDTMATKDCMKHTSETVRYTDPDGKECKRIKNYSEFWSHKCVQYLQDLPEDYLEYFTNKYDCSKDALKAAISSVREASTSKLAKFIESTQTQAKLAYKA